MKLPNVIIAGVHKAGTTSLYKYLSDHPDVFASPVKETHYFTPLVYNRALAPLEDYARYFSKASGESILLEASPSYLYGGSRLIASISKVLGEPRFIVILRDPVERFVSHYSQMLKMGRIPKDEGIEQFFQKSKEAFEKYRSNNRISEDPYNRGIREGVYADYIGPWLEMGKDNRLRIVFFDTLKENPQKLLVELAEWLGIAAEFYSNYAFEVENRSFVPRNSYVHKLVSGVYVRNEVFFRQHWRIKSVFKAIYSRLNKENSESSMEGEVRNRLSNLLKFENERLRQILMMNNYSNLPDWIKK